MVAPDATAVRAFPKGVFPRVLSMVRLYVTLVTVSSVPEANNSSPGATANPETGDWLDCPITVRL